MQIRTMIAWISVLTMAAQTPVAPPASVPLYRVTVVQNSAKAINYRYLKASTKIDFKGTALAPAASGMAKVSSETTITLIKAKFMGLPAPSRFGAEYLTYVLWAISPEGRAANLGEIPLKNGEGKLKVTEPLQTFGLVVTAEPYFAVTQPSDAVVMENAMRPDTKGKVELIDVKYDLLKRGQYHLDPAQAPSAGMDKETPFAVYQARNALAIAGSAGAGNYAAEPYAKAQQELAQSENPKEGRKGQIRAARAATQSAEDARLIAVKRQEQEALENERKQAQAAIDLANQQAALAKQQAAQAKAAAEQASSEAAKAQQENTDLKAQLLQQLNAVVQTRATARGLIVNLASGISFTTGRSELLPAGREKLARVAGIILAHPGLKLEVEGYTDSTGSDDFNQKLSEKRAEAARDYLVSQGVRTDNIVSRGLGKANPVDSNDTASGRQNNRRVELVVSGTGITSTP